LALLPELLIPKIHEHNNINMLMPNPRIIWCTAMTKQNTFSVYFHKILHYLNFYSWKFRVGEVNNLWSYLWLKIKPGFKFRSVWIQTQCMFFQPCADDLCRGWSRNLFFVVCMCVCRMPA
jgi:hypothetical protein